MGIASNPYEFSFNADWNSQQTLPGELGCANPVTKFAKITVEKPSRQHFQQF